MWLSVFYCYETYFTEKHVSKMKLVKMWETISLFLPLFLLFLFSFFFLYFFFILSSPSLLPFLLLRLLRFLRFIFYLFLLLLLFFRFIFISSSSLSSHLFVILLVGFLDRTKLLRLIHDYNSAYLLDFSPADIEREVNSCTKATNDRTDYHVVLRKLAALRA